MIYEFEVKNDNIEQKSIMQSFSGNRNYYQCHIKFLTEDWDNKDKFAVFTLKEKSWTLPLENDVCVIPEEALKSESLISFGVFGVDTDKLTRISTGIIPIYISEGAYKEGETPPEITPDMWEIYYNSIKKIADEAVKIANSVREDADNGKFNGKNGKDGKDGTDGKDAITDQEYNPESENAQSGKAVAEALSEIDGGGVFTTIANITLDEAVNAITIDETSFPDITKVKDFYIALSIAKTETTQSGNLLIKSKLRYSTPALGVIKTWNHASYVMTGNFYSKWFDNGFRFNSCTETLGANNTIGVNLMTTIAQTAEPIQAITIQCATATSLIPVGSKVTIRGYIGE